MGEALLPGSRCCWSSNLCRPSAAAVAIPFGGAGTAANCISSSGRRKACARRFLARPQASSKSRPQQQQQPEFDKDDDKGNDESSNDDLNFLWRLVAGSFGGAAVIKYGSTLFPEITRPNIFIAMLMVGIPVLVSVLLLIKQSSSRNHNQDPL